MNKEYTVLIWAEEDGYIALCQELDVISQGDTIEEARSNLQEAIELFRETASPLEIEERIRSSKKRYSTRAGPTTPFKPIRTQ